MCGPIDIGLKGLRAGGAGEVDGAAAGAGEARRAAGSISPRAGQASESRRLKKDAAVELRPDDGEHQVALLHLSLNSAGSQCLLIDVFVHVCWRRG